MTLSKEIPDMRVDLRPVHCACSKLSMHTRCEKTAGVQNPLNCSLIKIVNNVILKVYNEGIPKYYSEFNASLQLVLYLLVNRGCQM